MGEDHYTAAQQGHERDRPRRARHHARHALRLRPGRLHGRHRRASSSASSASRWPAAVAVSLFVSFTLDPMLSSVWYDPVAEGHASARAARPARSSGSTTASSGSASGTGGVIGWALSHRGRTLGIAVASFVAALALFPLIGGTFMPDADNEQLAVHGEGAGRLHARLHARSRARGLGRCFAAIRRSPTPTRRSPAASPRRSTRRRST